MQSLTRERDGFKNFCREINRGPRIQANQTLAIVPLPPNVVVLSWEFSSSAPTQKSFFISQKQSNENLFDMLVSSKHFPI